jgi:hypothetical protein
MALIIGSSEAKIPEVPCCYVDQPEDLSSIIFMKGRDE